MKPLPPALPFWLSLGLPPLAVIGMAYGGWTIALLPLVTWWLFTLLDAITGHNTDNPDPATPDAALRAYQAVTLVWFPVQLALLVLMLWYVPRAAHLATGEKIGLFFGMGVVSGTIGINYAHELMHQKSRLERWLADLLLASVLYSHFRSEHLRVHHIHVGTPRDPVTARYNEGFHRSFPGCCGNARNPLGRPRQRCWPARACPAGTPAIHSGAMPPCRRGSLFLPLCWGAGPALACSWCKPSPRSGSWNW